jgi:exodeoxyribonuclease V alpha subunit
VVSYEGQIENIIFHNRENGYTVAVLATVNESVTVTGSMPFIHEGENIRVEGEWIYHTKYGRQLNLISYERILPNTVESIEAYLSSGMFKGIGKVMAKRITERFGEETLDVIMFYPDRLAEVRGISRKKAQELAAVFDQQKELRNITMFLQKYGLGPAFAPRIYKEFGNDSVEKITENPYLLADKVTGIGFRTADRIAFNLGIEYDSEFRIRSGIRYSLTKASMEGHTYLPKDSLIEYAGEILEVDTERIKTVFGNYLFDKAIVYEGGNVYLFSLFSAEKNAAFKLVELFTFDNNTVGNDIDGYIEEYERSEHIVFEKEQKEAVINSVNCGVSIITGGPGTGKTTIIKGLVYILEKLDLSYALCAPTGRAAKRMEEATCREAKTIHRLLEAGYSGGTRELEFRKNNTDPLEYDYIIIDEMSMVDITLFNYLLSAIMPMTRVVMVGDKDQLPSVGPGSVIRDLLASDTIPHTELKHIFRQDENSLIVFNAHRINKGEMPVIDNTSKDFFVISRRKDNIADTIIKLCTDRLPEKYSFDWKEDICVLTPVRKGELGVEGLNVSLKSVLNPPSISKKEIESGLFIFREGDRVMQIKNNYDIKWYKYNNIDDVGEGLYNGDIGFIDSIDTESGTIEVLYDNEKVGVYEKINHEELEPAFATTIHKSQGSEFNVVIIPLFSAPRVLLTRNLLYTALTRAKKMAIFVGDEEILREMIENENENRRFTSLDKRLKQFMNDG